MYFASWLVLTLGGVMDVLLYVVAALAVGIGTLGTFLPAIPGAPLVFGGLLLAAWINDFQFVSPITIGVLGVLTLLSLGVDFLAGAAGAKKAGASGYAVFGAVIGTFIGIAGGIFGLLVGPFIGAAAGELWASRDLGRAGSVGFATWLGMLIGTVIKLGVVFAMIGIFLGALVL